MKRIDWHHLLPLVVTFSVIAMIFYLLAVVAGVA